MNDSDVSIAEYNDPHWQIKTIGGTGQIVVAAYAITTDGENNVYITGRAYPSGEGRVDFDPSTGYDFRDKGGAFVTKLNADGTYAWTGILAQGDGLSLVADSQNNIYVVGFFTGTSDFNFEGPGNDFHTASGSSDVFITRINADGSYGWTKTFGGNSTYMYNDWARSVAVDGSDSIYVTGNFAGEVDFDPGPGTDIRTTIVDPMFPEGHQHAFITKFNSNGSYCWTIDMGPSGEDDFGNNFSGAQGYSIRLDSNGNIYVAGAFSGKVDFNPEVGVDIHTSYYGLDIFVTRINADRSYAWTKGMGSVTGNCLAKSLCLDEDNNIYVTGLFTGAVNFNRSGGEDIRESSSDGQNADNFTMKLGADGSYIWTRVIEVVDSLSIASDSENNIYLTGYFWRETDFNPGAGVDIRNGPGMSNASNIYITKLDGDGIYAWTQVYGLTRGTGIFDFNKGNSVHIDNFNNVLVAGFFSSEVNFDPDDSSILVLPSGEIGSMNAFIKRVLQ